MADGYLKSLLTPSVREAERHYYGREYPSFEESPETDELGESEREFIESRDSFYLATITEDGWPYLQHRGGPPGFLRVIDGNRIGFADYRGNRQMISVGSMGRDDRVSLFLMDYPSRSRLKIMGRARVIDVRGEPELAGKVEPPGGHASPPERVFEIEVQSYDWNCPKFITPRYTEEQIAGIVAPLKERIARLEACLTEQG